MSRLKPWFHMPCRFHDDERYLDLDNASGLAFHRMYRACDRWGRGPAGKHALSSLLRMSPTEVVDARDELAGAGLIELFESPEGILCFQLERYDFDCPGNTTVRRSPSDFDRSVSECALVDTRKHKSKLPEITRVAPSSDRTRDEIEIESPPTEGRSAHARRRESETPEQRTSTEDNWQPIIPPPPPAPSAPPPPRYGPPAPPRQQPDSLERVSPGLPIDDTLPPLGDTAQGLVDELVRRITATPMGTGLHSPGFFGRGGDSGMVAFEAKLRLLQERNPQAVVAASRGFWPTVDREGGPDHWPRDPTRRLEQWLADKGHRVPFAAQVMREVAGG